MVHSFATRCILWFIITYCACATLTLCRRIRYCVLNNGWLFISVFIMILWNSYCISECVIYLIFSWKCIHWSVSVIWEKIHEQLVLKCDESWRMKLNFWKTIIIKGFSYQVSLRDFLLDNKWIGNLMQITLMYSLCT